MGWKNELLGVFKPDNHRLLVFSFLCVCLIGFLIVGLSDRGGEAPVFAVVVAFIIWPVGLLFPSLDEVSGGLVLLEFVVSILWLYFLSCAIAANASAISRYHGSKETDGPEGGSPA